MSGSLPSARGSAWANNQRVVAGRLAQEAVQRALQEGALDAQRKEEEGRRARIAQEREELIRSLAQRVEAAMSTDYLGLDHWFSNDSAASRLDEEARLGFKIGFVKRWSKRALGPGWELDDDQAAVVANVHGNLLVIARAGSGKTRTLVARALFLQLHCRVDPEQILILAFNRKAVAEVRTRLEGALPEGWRLPHVATFHSLAYALASREGELIFDDESTGNLALSRRIQAIITDLLRHGDFYNRVRRAMIGFFSDDWQELESRGLVLFGDRRDLLLTGDTLETLGGQWVRSRAERLIANALFVRGLDYQYERIHRQFGFAYRPDFTVLVNQSPRVVIEYFGMMDDPTYAEQAQTKRRLWAKQNRVTFIELTNTELAELGPTGLVELLDRRLQDAGVPTRVMTEEEVWDRVESRATDRFTQTMAQFVTRCRTANWTSEELTNRVLDLAVSEESLDPFLELADEVYAAYLSRLNSEDLQDFPGMLWTAASIVRAGGKYLREAGRTEGDLSRVQYLQVDEYQDVSAGFHEFIDGIRELAEKCEVCCVGDDWQAINGYAGSDLQFFKRFEMNYSDSATQWLTTNYRSRSEVVEMGNSIMTGLGRIAASNSRNTERALLSIAHLETFRPTQTEVDRFDGDQGTPALLRLIETTLVDTDTDMAVLFRNNRVPWFTRRDLCDLEAYQDYCLSFLSPGERARVEFSTVHKYKGRERDHVVIAGASSRDFPFKNPISELFKIFGQTNETIRQEERRLFYVATTRARSSLTYLVARDRLSEFVPDNARTRLRRVVWEELKRPELPPTGMVEVRVYTHPEDIELRTHLKQTLGFRWHPEGVYWYVHRPAEGFNVSRVLRVLGPLKGRRLELIGSSGEVLHQQGGSPLP